MVTNILKKVIQTAVLAIIVVDNVINIKTLGKKKHKSHHNKMQSLRKIVDFYQNHSRPKVESAYNLSDSHEDIRAILEEKYKFRNDEASTRFSIKNETRDYPGPGLPESKTDRHMAWVFRAFAVRRIVGGMNTCISMYPYNVAISRNGKHWCGGSIIDEQWVLTAGHCLESAFDGDKRKLRPFVTRAGSSFHNRGGYQARINKVFFPPQYTPGNVDYDFSLLRLDRPMPIGRNIAVLNLPSTNYVHKVDDVLIVTGWGSTDETGYGHIPDRMHFVPVPVMRLENCQKSYQFHITSRMLCAGYNGGGRDACNHDSGGPAVRDGVLIGVVSFGGKRCGDPSSPGVYSRVSEITEFIDETIKMNEAYTVPELMPKIELARQRKEELQRFKARVETKKNRIKNWFRDTIKSPMFIKLAKQKLLEAGFISRRTFAEEHNTKNLDDKTIDDINFKNMINDRIIEDGDGTESDKLLRTLALHEVMLNEESEEKPVLRMKEGSSSIEAYIAYINVT